MNRLSDALAESRNFRNRSIRARSRSLLYRADSHFWLLARAEVETRAGEVQLFGYRVLCAPSYGRRECIEGEETMKKHFAFPVALAVFGFLSLAPASQAQTGQSGSASG